MNKNKKKIGAIVICGTVVSFVIGLIIKKNKKSKCFS